MSRCTWLLGIIGFDTAYVRGLFRHEDLHKFHQAVSELGGSLKDSYKKCVWFKIITKQLKERSERDRENSHHLWAFLVDHFLPVEATLQDLVVWLTHDLNRDQTTTTCQQSIFLFTQQSTQGKGCGEALTIYCLTSFRFRFSKSLFLSRKPECHTQRHSILELKAQ